MDTKKAIFNHDPGESLESIIYVTDQFTYRQDALATIDCAIDEFLETLKSVTQTKEIALLVEHWTRVQEIINNGDERV